MEFRNDKYSQLQKLIIFIWVLIITGCARYVPEEYIKPAPENTSVDKLIAQFYGTSSVLLSDEHNSVLIDGFVTRESLPSSIISRMKTNKDAIGFIDKKTIDVVLVAHSHFDHAKDSAAVANAKKAKLIGSPRTLKIVDANNEQLITSNKMLTIGNFKVSFIPSDHVKKSFSKKALEKLFLYLSFSPKFIKSDDIYSFYINHPQAKILIVPSANFPENWATSNNIKVDTVFLSIGLLGEQPSDYLVKYWKSTVVDTCAKTVIPIHWDDFRVPLSEPLEVTPDIITNISKAMKSLDALAQIPICNGHKPNILFPKARVPFLLDF